MIRLRHLLHPDRSANSLRQLLRPLRLARRVFLTYWTRLSTVPLEELPDAPELFRFYRNLLAQPDLKRAPGGWYYRGQFYPDYITVGGACYAVLRDALRLCKGAGVDVGAGLWPLPGAIPIDMWRGPGVGRSIADIPSASLDYVFSSHCLEHIEDWRGALTDWVRMLKSGGILFLYLPHPECTIWHRGSPFIGDAHKWMPTPEILRQALCEMGCDFIDSDDGPDAMFSFWICARRRSSGSP
jgi:hypothetical protein